MEAVKIKDQRVVQQNESNYFSQVSDMDILIIYNFPLPFRIKPFEKTKCKASIK